MTGRLDDRVAAWVGDHPRSTFEEIQQAVHARAADVRRVLRDGPFTAVLRADSPADKKTVWLLAVDGAQGLGRDGTALSQCDRIVAVLADGLPHRVSEIHRRAGFSRLNSRIAELRRRRGLRIECRHIPGSSRGADAYEYQLILDHTQAA